MTVDQKIELENLIRHLLNSQTEITLDSIAKAAGFSHDDEAKRKALRRLLQRLITQGVLEARGLTRDRVYSLATRPRPKSSFMGYQANFLLSYQPNQTEYLSQAERLDLLNMGHSGFPEAPAGTYAHNILDRLLIDLSWNSSRLEGNTYSLLETKRLIELGEAPEGKDFSEAQMILNHKGAIEYLVDCANETHITTRTIYSIHALLSERLLGDPKASGRIRQIPVGISGTSYRPLDNPHLIKEYFELFVEKLNLIKNPFEQSFFSLVHLSYLQAFEDVNKRTARLVANIPLVKSNLRPLSFVDVDRDEYARAFLAIYEKNDLSLAKDLYRWAYERSSQRYSGLQRVLGEPDKLWTRHRNEIKQLIRTIILERTPGNQLVPRIHHLLKSLSLSESDSAELFKMIEMEFESLHDGNVARYKVRPSEFEAWQKRQ